MTEGQTAADTHDLPSARGFGALRNPIVRKFGMGRMASTAGSQIVSVAVAWELYERTNDLRVLGLVGLVQFAPSIALLLPAGHAADRFSRRNLSMLAGLMTALVAVGLALVSWQEGPIPLIFGLLVLNGIARAVAAPASGTIIPQLIDAREFAHVNAWLVSLQQVAMALSPTVGGYLIWLSGNAVSSYLAAALSQLVYVAFLGTLPSVPPPPAAERQGLADLFAGFAFIMRTPIFLAAITLDLFAVLLGGAVALLPAYARDILEVGPDGLGLLRTAPGVGALVYLLMATRLPPWRRPGVVLVIAVAGFGVATIGFGLSREMWLSLVCLFLIGFTDAVSMIVRQTLMQVVTPDRLRGRVASVNFLFVGFSNELGAFESGTAAWLFGTVAAVAGGGIGTILVVLAVCVKWPSLLRIPPLHTIEAEPAQHRHPASPAARQSADSGVPAG